MTQRERHNSDIIQKMFTVLSELNASIYFTVEFDWSTINDRIKFSIISGKYERKYKLYPVYEALIFYKPHKITKWVNAIDSTEFILADFLEIVDDLKSSYPKRKAEKDCSKKVN